MRGDCGMIIRYSEGYSIEGIIQRVDGDTMRASVAGHDDAVEYRLIENEWMSAGGATVTFEFHPQQSIDPFAILRDPFVPTETGCLAGGHCKLRGISLLDTSLPN
jgi:hypothetical protein